MGFLLRDKQPQSLYQAFEIALDIECNIKYGVIRRRTPIVIKDLTKMSELKTCVPKDSLFQRGLDSFLVENSACVCNVTLAEDKVSSLDKVHMQDINSVVSSINVELVHVENITDHKIEGGTSQYQDEETRIDVSSDNGKVVDLAYCEEALYEANDEIC